MYTPNAIKLSVATAVLGLTGCASSLNTAGSGDFACPGMPMGVTCKTPAAVYKSSHGNLAVTDFDTPLGAAPLDPAKGSAANGKSVTSVDNVKSMAAYSLPMLTAAERKTTRPKPVREPAQVMRIWIAPWVDSGDVLHLAQLHYAEIVPRTWTVGKPEVTSGAGYVIPHLAFDNIGAAVPGAPKPNSRPEQRVSDPRTGSANAQKPGASSE